MTVKVITTIRCDKCGKDGPEQKSGTAAMINRVRMVAREYGWARKVRNGMIKDFCPDCLNMEQVADDAQPPDAASVKARWSR